MDICKDIILRALCHRLSLGGERYVNIDRNYSVRIDKEGILINGLLIDWSSIKPSFIKSNLVQLMPIINNTHCTVVHFAPWLLTRLLEEGAACYTHVYKEYPDIEVKEYILPGCYKFNIVKYVDQDDLFAIDTRDFIWMLRSWSLGNLVTARLAWNEESSTFLYSAIQAESVSYDSTTATEKTVIRDYNDSLKDIVIGRIKS